MSEDARSRQRQHDYAIVGELVLTAGGVDWQLNRVLISVLNLVRSPFLEPVVAGLDTRQKLHMLKERVKHLVEHRYRTELRRYVADIEGMSRVRNIVCHSAPSFSSNRLEFRQLDAARLLQKLDVSAATLQSTTMEQVEAALLAGRKALHAGEELIAFAERMADELARKKSGRQEK